MTTSSKLTYLNTTKQLLKTEINKINNVLDDNSTFRSYPQELFNGYLDVLNNGTDTLWSNLEKVSASGEEATLENVETAPIKMVLNGNTSQETTTGKQLFDKGNANITDNKWLGNDGHTVDNGDWLITNYIEVSPNTTYTVSGQTASGTNPSFCFYDENQQIISGLKHGGVVTKTYTTPNNCKYIRDSINKSDLDTYMLEQGSTATSYEPYTGGQPSPSPDYPQQVKVVKGENVVSVQGKNLINQAELLSSLAYNSATGYYEGTPSNQFNQEIRLNFKENTSYTFRCEAYQNASSGDALQFYVYYKNGTNSHINLANTTTSTIFKITSTASQTIDYLELKYIRARYIHIKDVCLVEGNDISYVPYSKTDYSINLGDIELCKINTYKDYFHKDSGKWYVHKEIGKVVLDGSESGWQKRGSSTNSYIIIQRSFRVGGNICMSDKFIYSGSYDGQFEHILVNSSWNENLITIDTSRLTENSLNGAKQWLSTNQPNMYYPLATPTEEEITNSTLIEQLETISKAKSVKDKTYITQTNDELPFILDVEAIKEYEVN